MNIFEKIYYYFSGILIKLFPSLGYKGVVDTQIKVYKKLKRKYPKASENDLLNSLIISRIKALPRIVSKEEEYAYYKSVLDNPDKTLEDVIWEIIFYENLKSRTNELSKKKIPPKEIKKWILEVKQYIKENLNKSMKEKIKRATSVSKLKN